MAYTNEVSVKRNNSTAASAYYWFRIQYVVNSINKSNRTANVTFTLQVKGSSPEVGSTLWSSNTQSYWPQCALFVNGTSVVNGYVTNPVNTGKWVVPSDYIDLINYTTDLSYDSDGTLNGTCGFTTQVGGSTYPKNYGPAGSTHSSDFAFTLDKQNFYNIRIKVNGDWHSGFVWVKANGTWKRATNVYTKVNGAWKKGA